MITRVDPQVAAHLEHQPERVTGVAPSAGGRTDGVPDVAAPGVEQLVELVAQRDAPDVLLPHGHPQLGERHELPRASNLGGAGLDADDAGTPSDTSAIGPDGVDGTATLKAMEKKYGFKLADGQDNMKGKIWRLSHMGYCDQFDVLGAIAALELAAKEGLGLINGTQVSTALALGVSTAGSSRETLFLARLDGVVVGSAVADAAGSGAIHQQTHNRGWCACASH